MFERDIAVIRAVHSDRIRQDEMARHRAEMRRVQRKAWELLAKTEADGDNRGAIVALREVRECIRALGDMLSLATVAGDTAAMFAGTSNAAQIKSGKLRALAVTGARRAPEYPDLPTIGEFYPGYEVTIWLALFAPAGTPEPVLARLRGAVANALAAPDVKEKFNAAGGMETFATTPEEFTAPEQLAAGVDLAEALLRSLAAQAAASPGVFRFNLMSEEAARDELLRCCGSRAWAAEVASGRPYSSPETLFRAAENAARKLRREDWLEAFSHHPRIGDVESLRKKFATTAAWAGRVGRSRLRWSCTSSRARGSRQRVFRSGW